MIVYGVLIKHATAGLLLFETGCHDDMEKYWGPVSLNFFSGRRAAPPFGPPHTVDQRVGQRAIKL